MEGLTKYYLYPPSKRVNYQRIGNPFIFCPNWENCVFNNENSLVSDEETEMRILINSDYKPEVMQQVKQYEKFKQLQMEKQKENTITKDTMDLDIYPEIKENQLKLKIHKNRTLDNSNTFLVPIQIEALLGGGIPEFNSLLCLPLEEDIKKYYQKKEITKPNLLIDSLNVSFNTYDKI